MDEIRGLVAGAFLLLLILLRLQAEEFGAAEYDELYHGERTRFRRRVAWYLIGFALIAAVYFIHPAPRDTFNLVTGRRLEALGYGVAFAVVGIAQAIVFALWRYGYLRLPGPRAYPDAAINAIGTAFVDEAAFRGILLGMMLAIGVDPAFAVVVQALVYALATRLGRRGRHPYMLLVALGIGLIGGWVTVRTGGIGAAFFGDAVTRFAIFVCTGHPGRVLLRGEEPEESDPAAMPTYGWRDARLLQGIGAEPRGLARRRRPIVGTGERAEPVTAAEFAPAPEPAMAAERAMAAEPTPPADELAVPEPAPRQRSRRRAAQASTDEPGR